MNYLSVYTFVQIVGESLPLSSSGNVKVWTSICSRLGLLSLPPVHVLPYIDFLLHIPALVILLIFFFKRWIAYIPWYRCSWNTTIKISLLTLLADCITCFFYSITHIFTAVTFPFWLGFLVTAVCLYSTRHCVASRQSRNLTYAASIGLGIVQGLALLPGLSRFATTFAYARWYGYKPADALWYSFLIQIPLLIGAGTVSMYVYYSHPETAVSFCWPLIIVATCIAYATLKAVAHTIDRCTFWHFSWYALGLAAIAFCLGL